MNKEHLLMILPWICHGMMFNSTISMSYPDVVPRVIQKYKVSLEAFRAIEAALVVLADDNMKDYSLVVD